jgi:hypothetical protein
MFEDHSSCLNDTQASSSFLACEIARHCERSASIRPTDPRRRARDQPDDFLACNATMIAATGDQ